MWYVQGWCEDCQEGGGGDFATVAEGLECPSCGGVCRLVVAEHLGQLGEAEE